MCNVALKHKNARALVAKLDASPLVFQPVLLQKAKLLHPDAQSQHGRADQAAFVQLLTAYQILSNARARELYDLSISSNQSELLRNAAAAGVQGG